MPRLSVNLHPEVSEALHRIMEHDQVNATEAIRRVIALRKLVDDERAAGRRIMIVEGAGHTATFRELILVEPPTHPERQPLHSV